MITASVTRLSLSPQHAAVLGSSHILLYRYYKFTRDAPIRYWSIIGRPIIAD